jgi:DNA-binding MarR family transcriptional regulator
MIFDALIANPGRLRILTALATEPRQPFVQLRGRTGLTDGNLATHARRLQTAGFIAIDKRIDGGKPVTTLDLTTAGRDALTEHARKLLAALDGSPVEEAAIEPSSIESDATDSADDDQWVD